MPGRGTPWKEGGHIDSTITGADVKDLTVTNADIAPSTIEGGKLSFFKSTPIVMTGAPIPVPHGLGRVPPKVTVTIIDGPVVYIKPTITIVGVDSTVVTVVGAPLWIVEIMAQ